MPRSSATAWMIGGLVLAAAVGAGLWRQLPHPAPAQAAPALAQPATAAAPAQEEVAEAVAAPVLQHWRSLSAMQRADQRARYAALQGLPEQEKTRLIEAAQAFDALPAVERERLQRTFEAQDQLAQRGWRLGPELGAEYPRLHALLAFVPVEQHAPLLQALRAMSPQSREDLAVLVQRTPPQERQGLRDALLATAPQARAQWLHTRLQE